MKRILGSTVAVLSLAAGVWFPAAAGANAPGGSESITTTFTINSFPTTPPYTQTYPGTYTATGTFDDSGSVSGQTLYSAVPSPTVGGIHQLRTYTSDEGHGTLVLRCSELRTGLTTGNGSCAVISATGDYTTLFRSGKVTYFDPLTSVDTVTF